MNSAGPSAGPSASIFQNEFDHVGSLSLIEFLRVSLNGFVGLDGQHDLTDEHAGQLGESQVPAVHLLKVGGHIDPYGSPHFQ